MENFIRLFVRIERGKWTCVRDGEFHGPNGRIQVTVGTTFTRTSDWPTVPPQKNPGGYRILVKSETQYLGDHWLH